MHFIDYILLWSSAFIGGIAYFIIKPKTISLKLLLTFSGAYLFCLTAIHLLPELYSGGKPIKTGVFIVTGFILQIIIEIFTQGAEHGHIHLPFHTSGSCNHPPYKLLEKKNYMPLLGVLSGLSIHSFLEGMPLSCSYQGIIHLKINPLLTGILLHNLPIAYTLVNILFQSGLSKKQTLYILLFFSCITPLGSIFSYFIQNNLVANIELYNDVIMAVVVGIFLHISTTILFESSANHKINLMKIITVIAGAATAVLFEFI